MNKFARPHYLSEQRRIQLAELGVYICRPVLSLNLNEVPSRTGYQGQQHPVRGRDLEVLACFRVANRMQEA